MFQSKDRYTLSACTIHDGFYPIRFDYDKLNHGAFLANLCEIATHPGEPCEALFTLLIRALNYLTYRDVNPHALSAAFMYRYSVILGYKPRLSHCAKCESHVKSDERLFFDADEGGVVCATCKTREAKSVTHGQIQWLKAIHEDGFEAFEALPNNDAPFSLMLWYVQKKADRPIKNAHLLAE